MGTLPQEVLFLDRRHPAQSASVRMVSSPVADCILKTQISRGKDFKNFPIQDSLLHDPVVSELISRHHSLMAYKQSGRSAPK